jgi:hypothetical protein
MVVFSFVATSVPVAEAQFVARLMNPVIEVSIEHPPELIVQFDTVVFGQATAKCENEIVQALVDSFLQSGLEVVDREHLDGILAEHDLAARGFADPSTMLRVGELIGPSVLVSVRATRCVPKQETSERKRTKYETRKTTEEDDEGNEKTTTEWVPIGTVTTRVARTSVDMRVSLRVVDLTTGRVFAGRSFAASPVLQNSLDLDAAWDDSAPAYPPESAVIDLAVESVLADMHRMFFSWNETRSVVFYNNDRCGLRSAYRTLEIGDHERALDLSTQNLEHCQNDRRAKRKVLANAYYNLGIVQTIVGEYEESLRNLAQAERLRPGSVVNQAIGEARAAQSASEARARFNEETESLAEATDLLLAELAESEEEALKAEAASTLTNDDVVGMVEAGLPKSLIVARIRSATTSFSVQTADLKALIEAGVSEEVILAMISAESDG